ncbi:MAG: alpha/beta hydrolase, partial [Gallicola sp.]|nr:alpha/beta hydrolase [Gallicola sp.]
FDFTANGYHFLLEAMERMDPLKKEEANLAIPLFIVSGEEDPVGEFGKCPKITYQKYIQKGYTDVSLKLYPNNRHELLHDRDKEQVLEDLYQWMIERREEE